MSEQLVVPSYDRVDSTIGKAFMGMYRVPHIEFGYDNVAQFFGSFLEHTSAHLFAATNNYGNLESYRTQVFNLKGGPGSGKTFLMQRVKKLLEAGGIPKEWIVEVGWEPDGEKKAYDRGQIRSLRKVFSWEECLASEEDYRQSTLQALRARPLVVLREDPSEIAAQVGREWVVKRPLGGTVGKELSRGEGEFKELPYDEWNFVSVGGPLLRHVLVYGREEVRDAKPLKEADRIAHIYGFLKPEEKLSYRKWRTMKNGATLEQIENIEQLRAELLDLMADSPTLQRVKHYAAHINSYDELTKRLIPEEQLKKLARPWEMGAMWEDIMRSHDVDPNRTFIGYNNVSLKGMGITTSEQVEQLANHLEAYKPKAA